MIRISLQKPRVSWRNEKARTKSRLKKQQDPYELYHYLVKTVIANVAMRCDQNYMDNTDKEDSPTVHIPWTVVLLSRFHACFLSLILPHPKLVLTLLHPCQLSKRSNRLVTSCSTLLDRTDAFWFLCCFHLAKEHKRMFCLSRTMRTKMLVIHVPPSSKKRTSDTFWMIVPKRYLLCNDSRLSTKLFFLLDFGARSQVWQIAASLLLHEVYLLFKHSTF